MENVLASLMRVIQDRRANPPPRSYTASLFAGGVERIGEKLREEAAEAVEAAAEAGEEGRRHLIHEAADVVYHLLVLMGLRDVTLADLEGELAKRFGISGLDEKAARQPVHNAPSP
jgi:phosphoribosyl-ATP pyrophosphohydrolase